MLICRLSFVLFTSSAVATAQTATVIDGYYTNAGPVLAIGSDSSFNTLSVMQNGWLENGTGIIGQSANAHTNSVLVHGQGSRWDNTSGLYLGQSGSGNFLHVRDGGRVSSAFSIMAAGELSGGNVVQVEGTGSRWDVGGEVQIGVAGSHNTINLINGGRFQAFITSIGYLAQSRDNRMRIHGVGSVCGVYDLQVGSYGSTSNRFSITGGGITYCGGAGLIGNGDDNLAVVSDPGSAWYAGHPLFVGVELGARNSLVISNSALASCSSLYIDGDQNSVLLTGPGSTLETGGLGTQILIGYTGQNNRLLLTNGAQLRSWAAYLTGASNSAQIVGAGSSWSNYLHLKVGEDYSLGNQLTVRQSGQLLTHSIVMAGDQGALTLRDPGSFVNASYLVSIGGEVGAGNIFVLSHGARMLSGAGIIGGADSSLQTFINTDNAALITGAGSRWLVASNLIVGATGPRSRLTVENGGYLECQRGYLGQVDLSPNNVAIVSGGNSTWRAHGDLFVGHGSWNNTLLVTNAGAVLCSNAFVGRSYTRFNKALVAGPGSLWNINGQLVVGNSGGENQVVVSAGGGLNTQSAAIDALNAFSPGKNNAVVLSDSGTFWANQNTISVGASSGFNHLRIENGASVVTSDLFVGNAVVPFENDISVIHGSLTVSNRLEVIQAALIIAGGTLVTDRLIVSGNQASLLFSSGQLHARLLDFNAPQVLRIGNDSDSATLLLGAGTLTAPNGVRVSSNAVLQGAGTLRGSLTNAGSIKPGSPLGTLNIEGHLTLLETGDVEFELGGATGPQRDFVQVRDLCFIGGTLRLKLRNGFLPASNDVFVILSFPAGRSGEFSNAPDGDRLTFDNSALSCRIEYTPTEVRLLDFQNAAPAGGQIDDAWAIRYFGHAPLTEAEKRADFDGDGHTTYQEYLAGTAPNNPASVLKMLPIARNALGQWIVRFQFESNKIYSISSSSNLLSWTPLEIISTGAAPSGIHQWIDVSIPGTPRFYRIDLSSQLP